MKTKNFFADNPDIAFHLSKGNELKRIYEMMEEEAKEAVGADSFEEYIASWFDVLSSLGQIAGEKIAGNAMKVDKDKLSIANGRVVFSPSALENINVAKDFGVGSVSIRPRYGGMGAPMAIEMAAVEMINRACPSTMLNVAWYGPVAHVLDNFASDELKERFIPKIAASEISGNMALTEAGAGSDLSKIRTYGEEQDDGTWKIFGSKRFISNGGSEISLVLAMDKKGAEGLKDLTLYLVPREIDGEMNVEISKLESKLGLKGSPTAELCFDGSKGYLIGERGKGFAYMLQLMNDSRIGVGFQGVGLMEATYRLAENYAKTRTTWGKPLVQHELITEKLLNLECEVRAIRSLAYRTAFERSMEYACSEYLSRGGVSEKKADEVQKTQERASRIVRRNTPLLKYWVGEKSVEHARTCLQIFGGYGYTTEYPAEWWLRESVIYSLYEGTSQIQALMYVKDSMKKIMKNPSRFVESLVSYKVKSLSDPHPLRKKIYAIKQTRANAFIAVLVKLVKSNAKKAYQGEESKEIIHMLKAVGKKFLEFEDMQPALLHAERLCEIKCYEVLAECLVEDALIDRERAIYAKQFLYLARTRIDYLKAQIDSDEKVYENLVSYTQKTDTEATI